VNVDRRVSVVVPTWNRWPVLGRAVRSALAQPETLEVIVVDDGSTDDSLEELEHWREGRLRLVARPHAGNVARLRNAGAARARAEWLAFLDSDDRWAERKLELQLSALEAANADWSFTGGRFVDEEDREVDAPYAWPALREGADVLTELLMHRVAAAMPSVVVRTEIFRRLGGCDESLVHDDYDLVLRLASRSAPAAASAPLVIVTKHRRRTSTAADSLRHHEEMLAVMVKCLARSRGRDLLRLVHDRCAFHLRQLARARRRLGRPAGALAAHAEAAVHGLLSRLPSPPCAPRWRLRARPITELEAASGSLPTTAPPSDSPTR